MATGKEAIEAIAKVTGMSPFTVAGAARALREDGGDLWPHAARGGGKNSRHVQPHHLVNVAIALAVANPLTESPKQAPVFTEMVPNLVSLPATGQLTRAINRWKQVAGCHKSRIIPGETLGVALAGLIDWLSRAEGAEIRVICKGFHVLLEREDGYDSGAVISYFEPGSGGDGWRNISTFGPYGLPLNASAHNTMLRTPGTIRRTSRLTLALFETLADLWADSRTRAAKTLPPDPEIPLPGGTSENENAGLPGPASTRVTQNHEGSATSHSADPNRGRETSQSPSRGSGRSIETSWEANPCQN